MKRAVYIKALNENKIPSEIYPSSAYNIPLTTLKDRWEECLPRSKIVHHDVI